jgi:hypothetical protein
MRFRDIDFERKSIGDLKSRLKELGTLIHEAQEEVDRSEARRLHEDTVNGIARAQISALEKKMREIQSDSKNKGFLGILRKAARSELADFEAKIEEEKRIIVGVNAFTGEELRFSPRSMRELSRLKEIRNKCESVLEKKLVSHNAHRERISDLRARASSNEHSTRSHAASLKTSIALTDTCPYCNKPIGNGPHLDHIYPVSKGGQSRSNNMVWICAKCNGSKRNLTLTSYITKYSLNRSEIEQRLSRLGKDF